MQVQSYLFFDGRCEEAIEFYKKALGAKVEMMMRFKEAPGDHECTPGTEDKIMHSRFTIGDTPGDGVRRHGKGKPEFKGFSLRSTPRTKPRPTSCSARCPRAARCSSR